MDFRDTPEEAAFRQDAAAWLDRWLPTLPVGGRADVLDDRMRQWQRLLHEGGWVGLTWPVEYGGRALPVTYEAIFFEEAARRGAPVPAGLLGMVLAGPTILVHGTPEQRDRLLPPILSGDEVWCQGFSEPGSGSDLASLTTRAIATDGGWRISGQKVWTSFAHIADRCMLLARSDPDAGKHAGVTYFCAHMDGIDVRPLVMTNGDRDFNELFLDDLFVGREDVLGQPGEGWRIALTTLAFERGSLAFVLQVEARQTLDLLVDLAGRRGVLTDVRVLDQLGRFHAEVEAQRIGTVRALSAFESGGMPGPEASGLKMTWAHVMQDMTRFGLELLGAGDGEQARIWMGAYLRARGKSIEGGTDEIQRSIVAEKVLGLPRSR